MIATRLQPPWITYRLDKAEDPDLTLLCRASGRIFGVSFRRRRIVFASIYLIG
jgi:hypothetical protein